MCTLVDNECSTCKARSSLLPLPRLAGTAMPVVSNLPGPDCMWTAGFLVGHIWTMKSLIGQIQTSSRISGTGANSGGGPPPSPPYVFPMRLYSWEIAWIWSPFRRPVGSVKQLQGLDLACSVDLWYQWAMQTHATVTASFCCVDSP